jgi:hypothetical protein
VIPWETSSKLLMMFSVAISGLLEDPEGSGGVIGGIAGGAAETTADWTTAAAESVHWRR